MSYNGNNERRRIARFLRGAKDPWTPQRASPDHLARVAAHEARVARRCTRCGTRRRCRCYAARVVARPTMPLRQVLDLREFEFCF